MGRRERRERKKRCRQLAYGPIFSLSLSHSLFLYPFFIHASLLSTFFVHQDRARQDREGRGCSRSLACLLCSFFFFFFFFGLVGPILFFGYLCLCALGVSLLWLIPADLFIHPCFVRVYVCLLLPFMPRLRNLTPWRKKDGKQQQIMQDHILPFGLLTFEQQEGKREREASRERERGGGQRRREGSVCRLTNGQGSKK
ncbi:MAG: hypothetical protein J3R72DRAFT_5602 [Linnemannia gamsii]|nr:MAG: hypothetical protein J3R72DRAFT_5602 [Linnemannia gamsii]